MIGDAERKLVAKWDTDIKQGYLYKKRFSNMSKWANYRKSYRGEWPEDVIIPLNKVFSMGRALIPRTYFRNPAAMVSPRLPGLASKAQVVEKLDNYLLRELNLKYVLKRAILDTYLCGTGFLKVGYDSEFGYIPDQAVDRDHATVTQVSTTTGDSIEYRTNVREGMPWAIRVKPEDIITPYGISEPEALPWICHTIARPLKDVQEDQKYPKDKTKKLKGGYIRRDESNAQDRLGLQDPGVRNKYILLREVRDKRSGRMLIFCEDQLLLNVEDALQIEGLPYEIIQFNPDSEHFWAISEVKMIEPQQQELNEQRSQASRLRRLSILKFIYREGAFNQEGLDKLLSADINDIGVGISSSEEAPASAIYEFQPKSLTNDVLREQRQTEHDMRETIGFGPNQLGEFSAYQNKTKFETAEVAAASSIRVDEKKDIVADVVQGVLRKWNQIVFKFWTGERYAEIVGPEGGTAWTKYTGEQLKGEYDLVINTEAGSPVSKEVRHAQIKEMFLLLKDDPLINQVELRKKVLSNYNWIDPSLKDLVTPPPPSPPPSPAGSQGNPPPGALNHLPLPIPGNGGQG